jgi:hypothetical protein
MIGRYVKEQGKEYLKIHENHENHQLSLF